MVEKTSVQASLHKIADKVQACDVGAAARLRLLADAVGGAKCAEQWAACDIFKLIDPDGIVECFKRYQTRGRLIGFLELLRNTFIFSPIIVTWYGVSQAAQAYGDYNPDPGVSPRSFLNLWESGGKLPAFLQLSSIGLIDVSLLVFIAFLTFCIFSLSQTSEARNEREAQSLRGNLIHTLVDASLSLQADRCQPPLTAGDNLELVARQIDAMVRQTTTKFDAMILQVLNQFAAMTKQTNDQFAIMVNQTNSRLDAMARNVMDQFNDISSQMKDQLQESSKYLSKLSSFISGVDVLSKELHGAAQSLQKTNSELMEKISILVGPAKELAEQQGHLATAAKESVARLEGVTKTLVDLGGKQDRWSADLNDVLDTLNLGVERAMQLAANVGNFTIQQASFLEQLEKEREAQHNLAISMSGATVAVNEALTNMEQGSISLRSIAHDMKDILDLQIATDATNIAQSYASAAQAIEQGGQSLYEVGRKLANVIDELEDRLTTRK